MSSKANETQEYDAKMVGLLELVWGEDYLSPGGPDEVARILDGIDIKNLTILDIGSGIGGATSCLVEDHHAARAVGVDVDPFLVEEATSRARKGGLLTNDRLAYQRVDPGAPLPFEDGSFDAVFSKDSIIHIANKDFICGEIFRVLRPGGVFLASDWLRGAGPVSDEMNRFLKLDNLDYGMGTPSDYEIALERAGFEGIILRDRNQWYRELAVKEHKQLSGELYDEAVSTVVGRAFVDHEVEVWAAMIVVLNSGELRPTHLRATKPGSS